jgi:hypothetical protein
MPQPSMSLPKSIACAEMAEAGNELPGQLWLLTNSCWRPHGHSSAWPWPPTKFGWMEY